MDFSAHIAHGFLSRRGTRDQRVAATMTKVGPAVLNGGLSTLLAFILLSSSESYVCLSFFKIFFLICIFGLFNGLVALPVLLSIVGPVPQARKKISKNKKNYKMIFRLWRCIQKTWMKQVFIQNIQLQQTITKLRRTRTKDHLLFVPILMW